MTYCLERQTGPEPGRSLLPVWTRCAVCGNRALLDRVRMGQPSPEHWRVTVATTSLELDSVKKAG